MYLTALSARLTGSTSDPPIFLHAQTFLPRNNSDRADRRAEGLLAIIFSPSSSPSIVERLAYLWPNLVSLWVYLLFDLIFFP